MLNKHYRIVLKHTEDIIPQIIRLQITGNNETNYGGILDQNTGLAVPSTSSDPLLKLISVYCNKDSKYYNSEIIYNSVDKLLNYIKQIQRPDGTFDLITTNFYSAPDSSFFLQKAAVSYRIVEKYCNFEKRDSLLERLKQIIIKTGYGIMNGGFHTPNHRWVNASALLLASSICNISIFKDMAMKYLAEGIDCDEYGEYTEKSKGIYDVINNIALIIMSEELKEENLLDHVKRNLNMLNYFIEPNDSIFTENSIRQDKGDTFYPVNYYPVFLYMLNKYDDPAYGGMLKYILKISKSNSIPIYCLHLFMLLPELKSFKEDALWSPLNHYKNFFEESGVYRVRNDDYSFSLLRNNSSFLYFKVNNLTCKLKMCTSFFGRGQFIPFLLRKEQDGTILLKSSHIGNYMMPLEEPNPSVEWNKMDHERREIVNNVKLSFRIRVKEIMNGISINITSDGCTRVPFKLEIAVSPNTKISNESFECQGLPGQHMNIKSDYVNINNGFDGISIGPGFYNHAFTYNMRGSEPQSTNYFTIYYTDYTELNRTIKITKL